MQYLLLLVYAATIACCIVAAGIRLPVSRTSTFELKRRENNGDKQAAEVLHVRTLAPDILSLRIYVISILFCIQAVLAVALVGWLYGPVVAILGSVAALVASKQSMLHMPIEKLYKRYNAHIIKFFDRHRLVARIFRLPGFEHKETLFASKEDVIHQLYAAPESVISLKEKNTVSALLSADSLRVVSYMTPWDTVRTIPDDELLGPLVLDNLHKTGFSRFPVVHGTSDAVGMIDVSQFLIASSGHHSESVRSAMSPLHTVNDHWTLHEALEYFLKERITIALVTQRETSTPRGIITLRTIVKGALGAPPTNT